HVRGDATAHRSVAGHDHSAQERRHVLIEAEAEYARGAERADRASTHTCAEGLRAVFEERHAVPAADVGDSLHVTGETVEMRDHDEAGIGVDRALDFGRIDVAGVWLD